MKSALGWRGKIAATSRTTAGALRPIVFLLLFAAHARAQTLFRFQHPAMGTEFALYLYANSRDEAASASTLVFDEVDRIEQELSNYRESSELSRINAHAAEAPLTTDPDTFSFLTQSLAWSARSDGAFDITVGPLMKAWGFFRKEGRIPSAEDLAAIRASVGYRNVVLDPALRDGGVPSRRCGARPRRHRQGIRGRCSGGDSEEPWHPGRTHFRR